MENPVEKIKQQAWIGELPTYLESENAYICDPRDSAKLRELVDAGVLPLRKTAGMVTCGTQAWPGDAVVWQGWDLQSIPSAKDLLATIPGEFSADGELLNFFYGEQWRA